MADNEIVIKARDAAKQTLSQVRKDVSALERELRKATDELERTGKGREHVEQLSRALGRAKKEVAETRGKVADLNRQLDEQGKKTSLIERAWSKAGGAIREHADDIRSAGVVAAAAIGLLVGSSISAASGLEQSAGAVHAVFKESASQVEAWADSAAETVGVSEAAYNASASTIGAMLKNYGVATDRVATATNDLITQGADLSAMFGGTATDAIEALAAAMRGEADPAERYGLSLSKTKVAAHQAATGIENQAEATLDLIKVQMRASGAMGQFAREAGTFAGKQQRVNAAWVDARAELGQQFLPVATQALDVLSGLLDVVEPIPGPIKMIAVAVGLVAAAAMIATPRIIALRDAFVSAKASGGGFATGLSKMTGMLGGPVGIALTVATAALGVFAAQNAAAKERVENLRSSLDELGNATEQTSLVMIEAWNQEQGFWSGLDGEKRSVLEIADAYGYTADQLLVMAAGSEEGEAALQGLIERQKEAARLARHLTLSGTKEDMGRAEAYSREATALDDLIKGVEDQRDALSESQKQKIREAEATRQAGLAQDEFADSTGDATGKVEDQADVLKRLNEQFDTLAGKGRSLREAQASLAEAVAELGESFKDAKDGADKLNPVLDASGTNWELTAEGGRKAQEELFKVADAAERAANAAADQGKWQEAQDLLESARGKIAEQATQWGMAEDVARDYANQILGIPEEIATQIRVNAEIHIKEFREAARSIGLGGAAPPGIAKPVGDTLRPHGTGLGIGHTALAGIHAKIAATVPGTQHLTSTVRDWALGSPDSDHRFGRAYDVAGSNLGLYASKVRAIGGFAQVHGSGPGRHLHVVPAPAGASAVAVRRGGDGAPTKVVHAPQFTFPGVTDTASAAAAGRAAARAYQRDMERTARERR